MVMHSYQRTRVAIKLNTSPSHLALGVGASWEKLLTGTIEWER